jgi:hypothetical protein
MGSLKSVLIITGIDKTGKTTLAQALAKQTGGAYQHGEHPRTAGHAFDTALERLAAIEASDNQLHILDRFNWPDDMVYRPHLSKIPYPITLRMRFAREVVSKLAVEYNTGIILCSAPNLIIRQRFNAEPDELWKAEQVIDMQPKFDTELRKMNWPQDKIAYFDSGKLSPKDMLHMGIQVMKFWGMIE